MLSVSRMATSGKSGYVGPVGESTRVHLRQRRLIMTSPTLPKTCVICGDTFDRRKNEAISYYIIRETCGSQECKAANQKRHRRGALPYGGETYAKMKKRFADERGSASQ